jgi:hypothetical protein
LSATLAGALIALLLPVAVHADDLGTFDTRSVDGWHIHLEKRLWTEEPALEQQALVELERRLEETNRLLPAKRVEELRRIEFYVHLSTEGQKGYITRRGAGEPAAAAPGSIDLGSAREFLDSQSQVPSRVLHELAHGYHFQVLGADDREVIDAYASAVRNHLYTHVKNWQGRVVERSYALTSVFEYFALATQAYFERSGFFPFDRADLQAYDPAAYRLMRAVWQERPGPQPASWVALSRVGQHCEVVQGAGGPLLQTIPAVLAVRNDADSVVEVWWLSGRGEARKYAVVAPGELLLQRVFSPHVWQVRDPRDRCLAALQVGALGFHVTLER